MKYILILFIAISLISDILPQDKYAGRLPKSTPGVKITKITDEIYKIEKPFGQTIYKNFGNFVSSKNSFDIDSTIININTIDTLPYYQKYRLWREIPITNHSSNTLVIKNTDKNNYPELYGTRILYNTTFDTIPIRIYEYSPLDSNFHNLYTFPDSIMLAKGIYDINNDNTFRFFAANNKNRQLNAFKIGSSRYPTTPDFDFDGRYQMNNITFGDFDKDNINEMIYFSCSPRKTVIMKYNSLQNNFDSLYTLMENDCWAGGYSVGNIDNDGFNTIVLGTIEGNVHAIKYIPGNGFNNIWNSRVETYNAYLHISTNDIDSNGKNEFWVGGDAFYSGVPITRLTCFESDKELIYKPVARIDIVGIFSSVASNMFALDVDKCGKEELCLCLSNYFMIFKFTGTPNHHYYQVYYFRKNDMPQDEHNASDYYGAVMSDVDNDGENEIIISLEQRVYDENHNGKYRAFSKIYKSNTPASVNDNKNIKKDFTLSQNYPNPFNSTTNIHFELNSSSRVEITACNILGKELTKIIDENYSPGSYTVRWEAGSNLCSGVYLIKIKAAGYTKVIKSILLK